MAFEAGHERFGGRQKGTPNKKTLLRAAAVLADKGLSPTEELIKIAQEEETSVEIRIALWKFLQSFVEAPQTIPSPIAADTPEESVERAKAVAEHLVALSRPLEPTGPATTPQP